MTFFVEFLQPVSCDMRVYLGRDDIGMAKHNLDGSQIGTGFQEMARKGMPDTVRGDRLADSGFSAVFLDNLPEPLSRQRMTP